VLSVLSRSKSLFSPSITKNLGFAAPSAIHPTHSRRHEIRLALNYFNVHAKIMPQHSKNRKRTVVFFGAIFSEEVRVVQVASHKRLAI
jgi:hypothetical protein